MIKVHIIEKTKNPGTEQPKRLSSMTWTTQTHHPLENRQSTWVYIYHKCVTHNGKM